MSLSRGQRAWHPNPTPEVRRAWLSAAKVEAVGKGIPYGRVAFVFRLLFGEFPREADKR